VADSHHRTAAALIIGNELLSGKVHEQNLFCLAGALRALGIALRRVVMIPDEMERIVAEVLLLSHDFDQVFTSGGVGPTHDDLTVAAVAKAFGVDVVVHDQMAEMIRAHFGAQLRPGHLLMARIPVGCTLVREEDGKWPTILMHNVWLLPGVPEIFRMRLPAIKRHLAGGQPFVSRAVYTNLDEGNLVFLLEDVVRRFPKVDVGSYPKWNDPTYRTKLTFDSLDADDVAGACEAFVAMLPDGEPMRVT
jgi:molybdenum cofactor synthesis domain-containing protein